MALEKKEKAALVKQFRIYLKGEIKNGIRKERKSCSC